MNQKTWAHRRDILICLICAGIVAWVGWNIVVQLIEAIFLLLISMAIAFIIMPAVDMLEKLRMPRLVASIIVYIAILSAIGGFGYIVINSFVNQIQQFADTINRFVGAIPDTYSSSINFLETQVHVPSQNISDAIKQVSDQISSFANTAVYNLINIFLAITNALLDILIVIVLSFYLTLDGKRMRDNFLSIIPKRNIRHFKLFEDALSRVVGNYIRGQLTLATIIGILTGLVCVITGLGQFALIFGLLGFLFETIPMVGPGLASLSPILVSLLLPGAFPRTLIVVLAFILIQIIESNILGPRIVGHAVGLHPVASIMALLVSAKVFGSAFGAFGGAIGALVATPLVGTVWVLIVSIYRSSRGETADEIISGQRRAPWSLRQAPPAKHRSTRHSSHRTRLTTLFPFSQPRASQNDVTPEQQVNPVQDVAVVSAPVPVPDPVSVSEPEQESAPN